MAKRTKTKSAAKSVLYSLGYSRCDVCGRKMKDLSAHKADHKSKKIGADGRRTDRSKTEIANWKNRFNGTDATKKFRAKTARKKSAA